MSIKPKWFVNLHTHSTVGSVGDAIGYPKEYMNFAIENGMDGLALTDHGSMAGYSHMMLHWEKMNKAGTNFKAIPGCLLEGQEIITNNGIKFVEDICIGDEVLTHKGNFKKVISISRKIHKGKFVEISLAKTTRKLILTNEHPVYVRTKNDTTWIPAENIIANRKSVGIDSWNSYVCFPKTSGKTTIIDIEKELSNYFIYHNDKIIRKLKENKYYSAKKEWSNIPKLFKVTKSFARFLGLYTAEGSVGSSKNPKHPLGINGSINLTFNINETDYIKEVTDYLTKLGCNVSCRLRPRRGATEIETCNLPLAFLLQKWCGRGAKNKKIPSFIYTAPKNIQLAFLNGLHDGDAKNDNKQRYLKVASRNLAWGVKTLLANFDQWTSVGVVKSIYKGKAFVYYSTHWSINPTWRKSKADDKYIYKPIKGIKIFEDIRKVYNFEVEEDNSYVSDFILHNCEAYYVDSLADWSELYIKTKEEQAEAKKLAAITKATKSKKTKNKVEIVVVEENEVIDEEEPAENVSPTTIDEETIGNVSSEDESESRAKTINPLYQRYHLILLPKNDAGLKSLFRIVSESYMRGFYKYPRIDLDMLRQYSKGNIIAMQACMSGKLASIVLKQQAELLKPDEDWRLVGPNMNKFEEIQKEIAEHIDKFKEALGPENYFLEVSWNAFAAQHLINMHMFEASKRTSTKIVSTTDAHYPSPEQWKEREIYKQLARQTKGLELTPIPETVEELGMELYPKNAEQIWESYKRYSEPFKSYYDDEIVKQSIELTHDIAHQIIGQFTIDKRVKLPAVQKLIEPDQLEKFQKEFDSSLDEDSLAMKELVRLAIQGLKFRNKILDEKYVERLKYELDIVKSLKFAKYFLTCYKLMNLIRKEMLTGLGRGSGSGSLLNYVLNITQVDPIKHNLLFERFLVKHKASAADIDNDCSNREKAVKVISEYFGEENVLSVTNFSQLQLRSLLKDLAKYLGIKFEIINTYTSKIEAEARAENKKEPGFDAATWVLTYEEAENNSPSFRKLLLEYPELEKYIKVLFKQVKCCSTHAGGVVITDNPADNMPIIKSHGKMQTPWPEGLNYRHLESFGFLKFDILGLGTLRMFEECIAKIIKKEKGRTTQPSIKQISDWFYEHLHPDNNNMDDLKVYKNVYWDGNYAGIFQFINPNVQSFMKKLKPKNILDIAISTSLYRPGTLSISADKLYLRNRFNPSNITYKHPLLKDVLEETSGIIVFQEQIQKIYHKLAGIPLDETDNVRKAFTKKDISNKEKAAEDRKRLRTEFIVKCNQANNILENVAGSIFDEMEKFVKYSFCAAHATSYAMTSYICAYLFTYYPDEWLTAYLDYSATDKGRATGKEDPKVVAMAEARLLGYTFDKPDINNSEPSYEIDFNTSKSIIPRLSSMKHMGTSVYKELILYRKYTSVEQLLFNDDWTWRHSKFNKRALETLIKLEALDSMNIVGVDKQFTNYKQIHQLLIGHYDELKRETQKKSGKPRETFIKLLAEIRQQNIADWSNEEKMSFLKEDYGIIGSELIIPLHIREALEENSIQSIDSWDKPGGYWAIIMGAFAAYTKNGKPYLKLKLRGESGAESMCFVWNNEYKLEENNNVVPYKPNEVIIAIFQKNDFGMTATKIHRVELETTKSTEQSIQLPTIEQPITNNSATQ